MTFCCSEVLKHGLKQLIKSKKKMAAIIVEEHGVWMGKQLYKGQYYMSVGSNKKEIQLEKTPVKVDLPTLEADIEKHLGVKLTFKTKKQTILVLAEELCRTSYGKLYCRDDQETKYGVRKIID